MTPEVATLDRALALTGEKVVLRRQYGSSPNSWAEVECLAFVRGYVADQLVTGIYQTEMLAIISPTNIERAKWPGGSGLAASGDPRLPKIGDKLVVRGGQRNVEAVGPIYVRGELVRIEMRVKG